MTRFPQHMTHPAHDEELAGAAVAHVLIAQEETPLGSVLHGSPWNTAFHWNTAL